MVSYADAMARGKVAMATKNFGDAVLAFSDAVKAQPTDVRALQEKQKAQEALQGSNTAAAFDAKLKQAETLLAGQKYDQAGRVLAEAIALQPGNAGVQTKINFAAAMSRAQVAMAAKQYPDAITNYKLALGQIGTDAVLPSRDCRTPSSSANRDRTSEVFDSKVDEGHKLFRVEKVLPRPTSCTAKRSSLFRRPIRGTINCCSRTSPIPTRWCGPSPAMNLKNYPGGFITAYNEALRNMAKNAAAAAGLAEAQRLAQKAGDALAKPGF